MGTGQESSNVWLYWNCVRTVSANILGRQYLLWLRALLLFSLSALWESSRMQRYWRCKHLRLLRMGMLMKNLLEAWDLKTLQELRTLYVHLKRHNRTMEEFVDFVEERRKQSLEAKAKASAFSKRLRQYGLHCPKCSAPMTPFPVNTGPRDQIGGNYKTQWICPRAECRHEVFREDSLEEFIQKRRK